MDYGKLLSRSFEITRTYRALWLFGILLALFGGGGGNFSNAANFSNGGSSGRGGTGGAGNNVFPTLPSEFWQAFSLVIVGILCLILILFLLSIVLRFVSRGALIGLVQELEANATTPTVRRGFSIGGSRFWQLLGIALTINVPLFVISLALFLIAALPVLASILPMLNAGQSFMQIAGVFISGILGSLLLICCAAIFLWAVALVVRPFYEFFVRECVIQKRGVFDSIRAGYRIVRANVGNVAVLYILIIGLGIGFGIAMLVVSLILIGIPVAIAVAVGIAANSATPAIIAGAIVGIPMLLILLFISGLFQTFESTLWTEGYLAIIAPKTPI
jgi:hypothetical protein